MISALSLRKVLGGGLATLFRIGITFGVNKVLAMTLGPAGFAVVGQFQNFLLAGQASGSLGMQNGWVSLTARFRHHPDLSAVWSSGLRITAWASLVSGIAIALSAWLLPIPLFFPGANPQDVRLAILLAAPGTIAITLSLLCQSVANGLGRHKMWETLVSVAAFLQGLWVLLFLWGGFPVLPVLATQSLVVAPLSLFVLSRRGFSLHHIKAKPIAFPAWFQYALMGILPMLLSPIAQTIVRSRVGSELGIDSAGLWQGAWRISDFFNVGFSALLGAVLLPQFAADHGKEIPLRKIIKSMVLVMICSSALVSGMVLFRVELVEIVLSKEFHGLSPHLPIQLLGDVFRSGGWVLGLALLAQQATKTFLFLEGFSHILFVGITWFGISHFGLDAPFLAYAIENFTYLVIAGFALRNLHGRSRLHPIA